MPRMGDIELVHGDCFDVLPTLAAGSFDAVITDPPYSSGGGKRGFGKGAKNYVRRNEELEFDDGTRDAYAHAVWTERWLRLCRPLLRERGWVMAFTDWRMLPMMCNAVQVAGYVWQNVFVWDKVNSLPHLGNFRRQCEFVVLATKGSLPGFMECKGQASPVNVYAEALRRAERYHATSKPVGLMRHLMSVLPAGARVLDPFAGGGSTLVAAREMGFSALGCELTQNNYETARARLAAGVLPLPPQ